MSALQTQTSTASSTADQTTVGVADLAVSDNPTAELVAFALGSCLGVTAYDPVKKVGGMVHVMLPNSRRHSASAANRPGMFVDTGVSALIKSVEQLGGDRSRMEVKFAGGADFLGSQSGFNIGGRNVEAVKSWLASNGQTPQAQDIGGSTARTMRLNLNTGTVSILSPGSKPYTL